jgi:hypothetical protein
MRRIPSTSPSTKLRTAVVSWANQRALGRNYSQVHEIILRTPEEINSGPYIDHRGRPRDCVAIVEQSDRYAPLGQSTSQH